MARPLIKTKGLFNKVKNKRTRRRFVISTIRKEENLFETAVFEANFFYLPRNWRTPVLVLKFPTKDEAWETHYRLASRLTKEIPALVFQDLSGG
jgi:hypothetical protein